MLRVGKGKRGPSIAPERRREELDIRVVRFLCLPILSAPCARIHVHGSSAVKFSILSLDAVGEGTSVET